MPEVDDGSTPPRSDDERMWWNRGYDFRSSLLTCRRCGAIVKRSDTYVQGRQYWQVHDEWHASLTG
ncbi:MAG: hypothetical protein JWN84_4289 [Nocardioides sp.]|jgi:hypothetical protein|nr:hypothetical protein [Nocardioides sp.]